MQRGSVIQTSRREGPNVWQFRWSERDLNGHRVFRKRVIGTVEQYADAAAVRHAASALYICDPVKIGSAPSRLISCVSILNRVKCVPAPTCGASQPRGLTAVTFVDGSDLAGALDLGTRLRRWKWKLGCMGSILPAPQEPRFEMSFVSSSIILVGMNYLIATQFCEGLGLKLLTSFAYRYRDFHHRLLRVGIDKDKPLCRPVPQDRGEGAHRVPAALEDGPGQG
jgi:hypothetical protein